MYPEDIRITLIQTDIKWEDTAQNLKILQNIILSEVSGTDLIILPECFTTGFTMNQDDYAVTMDSKPIQWMKDMVGEKQSAITGTLLIKENDKFYNRLIFINKSKNVSFYDKRHLFKMKGEESNLSQGKGRLIVKTGQWRICPLICYDLRFPVWSRYRDDYDILIYSANWPAARDDIWNTLLKARAIENMSYVIGVNRIGTDGYNISYSGNSSIYDPHGKLRARLSKDKEETGTFTLSLTELNNMREKFPVHLDADDFKIITEPEKNKF
ncbi:MAG: amidohydrolase [Bacteroidales bacterium]|nr:MAG: amidohydrolase [Bacteroidales bacterium]